MFRLIMCIMRISDKIILFPDFICVVPVYTNAQFAVVLDIS